MPPPEDRFHDYYVPEPNTGCWLWTKSLSEGYGRLGVNGKIVYAHRFSYELFVGEIPEGFIIDHKCGVRCCVNPDHLEVVTNRENIIRGKLGSRETHPGAIWHRAKTHCPHGHPYSGSNLIIIVSKDAGNERRCRTCKRETDRLAQRKAYQKKKLLRSA